MYNFQLIEESYQKFIKNLEIWLPEGMYTVNLELLKHFDLLQFHPMRDQKNPIEDRYFHIQENPDKITLINDEFIVWIIPINNEGRSMTQALVALNRGDNEPHLEAGFMASGVYNNSKLVLKILEKFLNEIHETEIALSKFKVNNT